MSARPPVELPRGSLAGVAPPPGNPRFALFDSLRGIAALAILVFHVASLTGALEQSRSLGDALARAGPAVADPLLRDLGLPALPPFVAARAAVGAAPSCARYLRRRVLRIVPAYWVALTVLAIFPGSSASSAATGGATTSSSSSTRTRRSAAASRWPGACASRSPSTCCCRSGRWPCAADSRRRRRRGLRGRAASRSAAARRRRRRPGGGGTQLVSDLVASSLPASAPGSRSGMALAVASVAARTRDGACAWSAW